MKRQQHLVTSEMVRLKTPYAPSVYGVGITGTKYVYKINGVQTKEYKLWCSMLTYVITLKRNTQLMKVVK